LTGKLLNQPIALEAYLQTLFSPDASTEWLAKSRLDPELLPRIPGRRTRRGRGRGEWGHITVGAK
jgi:hypothetical protein